MNRRAEEASELPSAVCGCGLVSRAAQLPERDPARATCCQQPSIVRTLPSIIHQRKRRTGAAARCRPPPQGTASIQKRSWCKLCRALKK